MKRVPEGKSELEIKSSNFDASTLASGKAVTRSPVDAIPAMP
jgi:hypothetical protein